MTLTTSITGEKIFNAVADSISSVTKINKTNINENTDLNKLNPEIDSLSRIEILMEVEKKMMDMTGLSKFSLDEGILEKGSTVNHFVREIENKLKAEGIVFQVDDPKEG